MSNNTNWVKEMLSHKETSIDFSSFMKDIKKDGDYYDLGITYAKETDKAIMLSIPELDKDFWLPKSQCKFDENDIVSVKTWLWDKKMAE